MIKVKVTNDQFIINGKIYMLQGNQYYFNSQNVLTSVVIPNLNFLLLIIQNSL